MADGHLRHVLLVASLHQTAAQDAAHPALVRSAEFEDGHQALEVFPALAGVASPNVARDRLGP